MTDSLASIRDALAFLITPGDAPADTASDATKRAHRERVARAAMFSDYVRTRNADVKRVSGATFPFEATRRVSPMMNVQDEETRTRRAAEIAAGIVVTESAPVSPTFGGRILPAFEYPNAPARVGSALSDRASMCVPLMPSVRAAGGKGYSGGDGMWHALDTIVREGFRYSENGSPIPVNAVVAARSRDAAHRVGMQWHAERSQDVAQRAYVRAYDMMRELVARTESDPDVYGVTATGAEYAPMGTVAGAYVIRPVRCGACEGCAHNGSRYVVGKCADPRTITEYVDAQRILSRAIYASAAESVHDSVNGSKRFAPIEEAIDLPVTDEDTTACGHGDECEATACRGMRILRAAMAACIMLGEEPIGNRGLSSTFTDVLLVAYGAEGKSDPARARVLRKLREDLQDTRTTGEPTTGDRVTGERRALPTGVPTLATLAATREGRPTIPYARRAQRARASR